VTVAGEGTPAGGAFIEQDPKRILITLCRGRARGAGLFRRHVLHGAEQRLGLSERVFVPIARHFRNAEIEHDRMRERSSALREQNIRRLEVTVNDAMFMRVCHRRENRQKKRRRALQRHRAPFAERPRKVDPVEKLHHEVGRAGFCPDVENFHDVRMAKQRQGTRFPQKTRGRGRRSGECGMHDFDGDAFSERCMLGFVDRPHGAAPELAHDCVPSEAARHSVNNFVPLIHEFRKQQRRPALDCCFILEIRPLQGVSRAVRAGATRLRYESARGSQGPACRMSPDAEPYPDTVDDPQSSRQREIVPVVPQLFLLMECDRPTAGGTRHSLAGIEEVVLGRGTQREAVRETTFGVSRLIVRVPAISMSSLHTRLRLTLEGWTLEDANSKNGSFVNGTRVQRCTIEDGDLLELGRTLFTIRFAVPTPAGALMDVDSSAMSVQDPGLATLLPALASEFETLARISRSRVPILLLGDTGTGKELLARAVHRLSEREGDFIAVNCGSLTPNLVESQLFGHTKGAFSGALRDEPGFIRSADLGSLLLDEVADLSKAAQAALLRVIQECEVVPVGGARPIKIDVRVVAATHHRMEEMVARGEFRRDLWARLNGFKYQLRSLRQRREDTGVIAGRVLERAGVAPNLRITPDAGRALVRHDWPLNIRELEQCLLRAVALAESGTIRSEDLPPAIVPDDSDTRSRIERHAPVRPSRKTTERVALPLSERDLVLKRDLLRSLEEHDGNVTAVARAMGKARMQVQRWMKRFGLQGSAFRRT
jgi:DNA-binding NtrC family response regulator